MYEHNCGGQMGQGPDSLRSFAHCIFIVMNQLVNNIQEPGLDRENLRVVFKRLITYKLKTQFLEVVSMVWLSWI